MADQRVTAARGSLLRRHRDFRLFWAGQSISVLGNQITVVAMPLAATLTLHVGAGAVSAIATATYLPNVLFPLLVGHWLEQRRKRATMIAADLARAAILAVVPVAYLFHSLSVPLLAGVGFLAGTGSVVFDIGSFAFVPALVNDDHDLAAANRAMQGSLTVAQTAGPGVAGLLVQAISPAPAIAADAFSFVASAAGLALGRAREEQPPEQPESKTQIIEGLRQVFRNPYLRALTSHAAIYNLASQVLTVNLVVYAIKERHVSAGAFGLALSAGGIGGFLGVMAALRVSARLGFGRGFVAALSLSTGAPLLLALVPAQGTELAGAFAACLFVAGIGLGCANVLSITLRQTVIPRGSLARSNGGYRLLIFGVLPLGSALGGLIGTSLGSRAGLMAGAIGLTASALPMLQRRIRRLRTPADAHDAPQLEIQPEFAT